MNRVLAAKARKIKWKAPPKGQLNTTLTRGSMGAELRARSLSAAWNRAPGEARESKTGRAKWCDICRSTKCSRTHTIQERVRRVTEALAWDNYAYGRR